MASLDPPLSSPRLERIQRWLVSPRAPLWIAAAVALLFGVPALGNGLALDDLLILREQAGGHASLTMFELGAANPGELMSARADGLFPWWTSDALEVSLFRPLSALTHALDLARWPGSPRLMHAHSVVWYVVLVLALAALLRRLVAAAGAPAWVAGLALLVYAIDDAHAINVGWLAARNSLIGAAFAVLALTAYSRARLADWRPGALLGPLALALALLASEASIAIVGYLVAHTLVFETSTPWRARARALLPYGLVVVAWLVLYRALGHGVAACGLYSDPFAAPLTFLGDALGRGALLVAAELGLPLVVELLAYVPGSEIVAPLIAIVACAIVGLVLRPLLRRAPLARFAALGMVLAALAHGTTVPQERYLLLIGIGGATLIACVLAELNARALRPRLARMLAWSWVVLHLILPLLLAGPRATGTTMVHQSIERAALALPSAGDDGAIVLINAPGDLFALYGPTIRARAGLHPAGSHLLHAGGGGLEVTRDDARTLRIRSERGWLAAPGDRVLRDRAHPQAVGERVHLRGLEVVVAAIDERGAPTEITVELAADGVADAIHWLVWSVDRPRPWTPPAIGERVHVDPAVWDFAAGG